MRYLDSAGLAELDAGGAGLTMTDAAVVYRSQGRYGQVVRVQVVATGFGRSSFEMVYRMSDRSSGADVALVKTGMAFVYEREKSVSVPADFRAQFDEG